MICRDNEQKHVYTHLMSLSEKKEGEEKKKGRGCYDGETT